jgi:hypothetical protein
MMTLLAEMMTLAAATKVALMVSMIVVLTMVDASQLHGNVISTGVIVMIV